VKDEATSSLSPTSTSKDRDSKMNNINEDIDISIIIVSYNTRDLLLACLGSLYQAKHDFSFEVIVSDNASSDGSEEIVRKSYPQVRVIQNQQNLGFGAAANRGAAIARGRYLVILNPDTLVPANTLRRLFDYLESSPGEKVVSCRLRGSHGEFQLSFSRFPTPARIFLLFSRLNRFVPLKSLQAYYDCFGQRLLSVKTVSPHEKPRKVDTVLGAFFMMPLKSFWKVGGFDERYFMHYEEIDLFRKLQTIGCDVIFLPDVSVVHYGGQATRRDYARMRFEQQRSLLIYLHKWHGYFAAQFIRLLLIILALFRVGWAYTILGWKADKTIKAETVARLRHTSLKILQGLLEMRLDRARI
jgi:GT2 family glycosyltransferase